MRGEPGGVLEQVAAAEATFGSSSDRQDVVRIRDMFGPDGPFEPPMAMMVSRADRDHIDMLRARSYGLAVERGHIRR